VSKSYVVYWNNMPAPYMVERFNAVARRGNVELEAWFSTRRASERSWRVDESEWEFRYRYLPGVGRGEHPLAFPSPLLGRRAPDLLVSLYASPAFLLGAALARLRGARTAFWAEVTFDSWVRRRRWKEALKSVVLPWADGILTAGPDGRRYVARYGVPEQRVHVVPHVVDYRRYAERARDAATERELIRERLHLRGTVFAYVGRLWHGKGVAQLLDAFAGLQQDESAEATLLLVGDGPEEASLRERSRALGLRNVVFAGFQQSDKLPELYAASDAFVFPTLGDPFGMVVLEAMACGLPVISTSAAGELDQRVVDGVNGFVVPPGDSRALKDAMARLLADPDRRAAMATAAVSTVAGQSPAVWAEAFERAVAAILSEPA
jgi:glycosyltransferase involved in cell wall biosynthesis